MNKLKAALIHVGISIVLISILYLIMINIWYPKPFFAISQVFEPLKLLIIVDVIIGPFLTFLVYKKGKKTLFFDLLIIAILQISAMAYGIYTIEQGRPSILVYRDGSIYYLNNKFNQGKIVKNESVRPSFFSQPKMGKLEPTDNLDIYTDYEDIAPIDDYKLDLYPHSISTELMKNQFKSKVKEIDALAQKYKDEDIVFYKLVKEGLEYYVVFSQKQNKIIDYLPF